MNRIGSIFLGIIAICLIVGLFTWRGPGEVGFYTAGATVEVIGPTGTTTIVHNTEKTINLTLKETAGKKAMIIEVEWELFDEDGIPLTGGAKTLIPPKEVGGETSVSIKVLYGGPRTGTGTLAFTATGYDAQHGTPIGGDKGFNMIPGYSSVNISA